MIINLIAIGKNMPNWINQGFQEYDKRMPKDYKLQLIEILAIKRTSNLQQIQEKEGKQMLKAIPKGSLIIALDERGQQWNTHELAKQLQNWHDNWREISLLIGGPEGLPSTCLTKANLKWSLSNLTLPHAMIRIIVAEQLYRAWSILTKHPYHRD
jgi:23S rRNA (pseudouridine1915-N3)-methyltransferase